MVDKGITPSWVAWGERLVLGLLLALVLSGISSLASINARIDVVIERQTAAARIVEDRASHEARLVAIESSRFTAGDADKMRQHFDGELLDLWKELQEVKAGIPVAHEALRDRLETVMSKLEARIRSLENGK